MPLSSGKGQSWCCAKSKFIGGNMIELHGWLSISETYENEDLFSLAELESISQNVKDVVLNNNCGVELQYRNGFPFITTLLCANHRTEQIDNVIAAYKNIAEIATGSYGVIYIRDDEDEIHYNEFQIYIFKRGKCIYKVDTDFSPCIPSIEKNIVIGSYN